MFRHSYIDLVRLVALSLMLSGCIGQSVSITQSPLATESSPPSPTLAPQGLASKIDKTLNFLTERESFTGAVLVARNGEILLS